MALDVLDDVFIHDLALEAFERAFEALACINQYFSQQNTSFSKSKPTLQGSSFRPDDMKLPSRPIHPAAGIAAFVSRVRARQVLSYTNPDNTTGMVC